MGRPDRLTDVQLAAARGLTQTTLHTAFSQPQSAIDALTNDLRMLWDQHRTDDFSERRIGTLTLSSGAYFQWIGYSDVLAVECSSNTFLQDGSRLSPQEEATLLRAGFGAPDDDEPNFWLVVENRDDCTAAALAVVVALTAVFGVYAG